MSTSEAIPLGSPPTRQTSLAILVFSSLFITVGLAALLLLMLIVVNDPAIQTVLNWDASEGGEAPSLVLAFLSQIGLVVPVLLISASIAFVSLGVRLWGGHILAGRWAQTALLWLGIGAILLAFANLIELVPAFFDAESVITLAQLLPIFLPLVLSVPLFIAWWWLGRNLYAVFHGQENLQSAQARSAWNLLIPSLVIFVFVAARPLEQTFIRSLTDKRFGSAEVPQFVGLENYQELLNIRVDTVPCREGDEANPCALSRDGSIRWASIDRPLLEDGYRTAAHVPLPGAGEERRALAISGLDDDFLASLNTTLVFAVVSVTLELIIGLFMAMVVNSSFAGRGLMRAVMLIPWAIPTVISARLWELILKDTSAGIVNRVLMDLSLIDAPQAWLSDPSLQLPAAIMVDVWKTSPFMALLLLAGLQTIPKDLYEAADVDGASRIRRFFSITLPLLRPTIAIALIFRMLDALRMFDLFNVLFGRQQLSMATYNYEVLVNSQQDGYASAVSMIIFVLIAAFAILYMRVLNVETD